MYNIWGIFYGGNMVNQIKKIAEEIEPELIKIRQILHAHPETSMAEFETHNIILGQLKKIAGLEIQAHAAGGTGVIAILHGEGGSGKTALLRADIDALPMPDRQSGQQKRLHACGHDGHTAWLIGAAMILSRIRENLKGTVKFVFQPGEEVGKGADLLVEVDKVLENPTVDGAFAAHGWPSIEAGKIGIPMRYAFGCVGRFQVRILGKGGHGSWPENVIDPIWIATEIYQKIPAILTRKIKGTESKVMSVTYLQAGKCGIMNMIPSVCEFGGTMRTVKREVMQKMGEELEKTIKAVCEISKASYESEIRITGNCVKNHPHLLGLGQGAIGKVIGKDQVFFIDEDNLGGENFSEFSRRVPSLYFFIGIKPNGIKEASGLHSPDFQFHDGVLKNAAAVFAQIAYDFCSQEEIKKENGFSRTVSPQK